MTFSLVVQWIGVADAMLLGVITSLVGFSLLRRTGSSAMAKLRGPLSTDGGGRLGDQRLFMDETLATIGSVAPAPSGFPVGCDRAGACLLGRSPNGRGRAARKGLQGPRNRRIGVRHATAIRHGTGALIPRPSISSPASGDRRRPAFVLPRSRDAAPVSTSSVALWRLSRRASRASLHGARSRANRQGMDTMAEANGNGAAQVANPQGAPSLNAMVQFTKDFSFENPNAPRSLGPQEKAPNISIQVNVNAKQLAETDFEVNVVLEGIGRRRRRYAVQVRARLCRYLPPAEHSGGTDAPGGDDRMPAPAVPVRAADHRRGGARRRLPAPSTSTRSISRPSTQARMTEASAQQAAGPAS